MPLPKPPATKATILSAAEFESQAAPRAARKPGKPELSAWRELATGLQRLDTEAVIA